MSYYSAKELSIMGFKYIGKNVLISDKCSIYNTELISIGDNSRIDDFCVLSGVLVLGKNVHITCHCMLSGGDEGIYFDNFTTLAYRVSIFTRSDDYLGDTLTNSTIPEEYRYKTIKQSVYIRKHAIIGAGSVVMPGANIEEGVSIGAMSLVNKSTEPWGVYFGIPATRKKERKKILLKDEKKYLDSLNYLYEFNID